MILPGMPRPMPMKLGGGFQPLAGATWNPSDRGLQIVLSNGNLTITKSSTTGQSVRATQSVGTGKYYWEASVGSAGNGVFIGIANSSASLAALAGVDANSWGYRRSGPVNHQNAVVSTLTAYVANDIIGIALDLDSQKLHFSLNGVWQASSNPDAGTGGFDIAADTWFPFASLRDAGDQFITNFDGPFVYL